MTARDYTYVAVILSGARTNDYILALHSPLSVFEIAVGFSARDALYFRSQHRTVSIQRETKNCGFVPSVRSCYASTACRLLPAFPLPLKFANCISYGCAEASYGVTGTAAPG